MSFDGSIAQQTGLGLSSTDTDIADKRTGKPPKKRSLNSRVERYIKRLAVSTNTLLTAQLYGAHAPHSTQQHLPIERTETIEALHALSDIVEEVEDKHATETKTTQ